MEGLSVFEKLMGRKDEPTVDRKLLQPTVLVCHQRMKRRGAAYSSVNLLVLGWLLLALLYHEKL